MNVTVKPKIWTVIGFILFAAIFFVAGIVANQQYERAQRRQQWEAPVVEQLSKSALDSIVVTLPSKAQSSRSLTGLYVNIYNGTDYNLHSIVLRVTGSADDGSLTVDRLYRVSESCGSLSSRFASI